MSSRCKGFVVMALQSLIVDPVQENEARRNKIATETMALFRKYKQRKGVSSSASSSHVDDETNRSDRVGQGARGLSEVDVKG